MERCIQKCIEPRKELKMSSNLSGGKGIASVANSTISKGIYGCHDYNINEEARHRHINRQIWHNYVGKRGSFVAPYLGIRIVLTRSPKLATHV
jgi:hypothetical protein